MAHSGDLGRYRSVSATGLFLLCLVLVAMPAQAVTDIVIAVDQVVRGAEGSEHLIASSEIPPELRGQSCPVRVVSHNQQSVHPDSDLIIASGSSTLIVEDVESDAFIEVVAEDHLTLSDVITVTVRLGPDRVFSGGITVTVECSSVTTTTVDVGPSSTISTSTTTSASTSTTSGPTTTNGGVVPTSLSTTTETVGGIVVTNTSNPQVASTLPFTGLGESSFALLAVTVVGIGGLLLVASRRVEDRTAPLAWSPDEPGQELEGHRRILILWTSPWTTTEPSSTSTATSEEESSQA